MGMRYVGRPLITKTWVKSQMAKPMPPKAKKRLTPALPVAIGDDWTGGTQEWKKHEE